MAIVRAAGGARPRTAACAGSATRIAFDGSLGETIAAVRSFVSRSRSVCEQRSALQIHPPDSLRVRSSADSRPDRQQPGGGLAGYHGTSHASMDWPELGEMLGAVEGSHREPTEMATVKIDDPASPLVAAFGGKSFVHQDEFYRFVEGPLSRDKVHVLDRK